MACHARCGHACTSSTRHALRQAGSHCPVPTAPLSIPTHQTPQTPSLQPAATCHALHRTAAPSACLRGGAAGAAGHEVRRAVTRVLPWGAQVPAHGCTPAAVVENPLRFCATSDSGPPTVHPHPPASTTYTTSSIVRLVSAMFVASTTLRTPAGGTRNACRCSLRRGGRGGDGWDHRHACACCARVGSRPMQHRAAAARRTPPPHLGETVECSGMTHWAAVRKRRELDSRSCSSCISPMPRFGGGCGPGVGG